MFSSYTYRDRPLKVDMAKPREDNRRPFDNRNRFGGGGGRKGGSRGGRGGRSDYSNRY